MKIKSDVKQAICISAQHFYKAGDTIPEDVQGKFAKEIAHYNSQGIFEEPEISLEEMNREDLKLLADQKGLQYYRAITNEKLIALIRGADVSK